MGVHQEVYETRMRYSDPEGYREMMKAKAAHQQGNSNATHTDTSISGRGASVGLEKLPVKHYSMNEPAPAPPAPSNVAAPAPQAAAIPKTELKIKIGYSIL